MKHVTMVQGCMECIGDLETIKKRVLSTIDSMEADHASSSKDRI